MPIYEYQCNDCRRRVSLLWRSFDDAATREPICPSCGGKELTRLMSRVSVARSTAGESMPDAPGADVSEDDPRSLARFMRQMADESGEPLGPELEEVVGRLEAGEDPEAIEKSLPDQGPGSGAFENGDDFGVM
jgi:putative FmdB family regulatory protein